MINFPNNPVLNQTYTYNNITFTWDGVSWRASATNVVVDLINNQTINGIKTFNDPVGITSNVQITYNETSQSLDFNFL